MDGKITLEDLSKIKYRVPNRGVSLEPVSILINNSQFEFDFDVYLPTKGKNLQRPLVWTLTQKQDFIKYVLLGNRIAPISLVKNTNKSAEGNKFYYHVIDGKQRLTTLFSFFKGEFPILVNEREVYISDLNDQLYHRINNPDLTYNIGHTYDFDCDEKYIQWFIDINFKGTPQDENHINELTGENK